MSIGPPDAARRRMLADAALAQAARHGGFVGLRGLGRQETGYSRPLKRGEQGVSPMAAGGQPDDVAGAHNEPAPQRQVRAHLDVDPDVFVVAGEAHQVVGGPARALDVDAFFHAFSVASGVESAKLNPLRRGLAVTPEAGHSRSVLRLPRQPLSFQGAPQHMAEARRRGAKPKGSRRQPQHLLVKQAARAGDYSPGPSPAPMHAHQSRRTPAGQAVHVGASSSRVSKGSVRAGL